MKRLFSLALLTVFILASIGTVSAFDNILPGDAYDMLNPANEGGVLNPLYPYDPNAYVLDVRTPAEWYWVGHPGMDKCDNGDFLEEPIRKVINIPWHLWEYVPQEEKYDSTIPNRFFDEEVVRQFDTNDIIIIMCRSGSRSVSASEELEDPTHPACKRLEELGYYNIYNMLGGFEGGKDSCGYRTKDNGWKKIGAAPLPYNYSDTGIWNPSQKGRKLHK